MLWQTLGINLKKKICEIDFTKKIREIDFTKKKMGENLPGKVHQIIPLIGTRWFFST